MLMRVLLRQQHLEKIKVFLRTIAEYEIFSYAYSLTASWVWKAAATYGTFSGRQSGSPQTGSQKHK